MLEPRRVALLPQRAKPLDVGVALHRLADVLDVLAARRAVGVRRVARIERALRARELRRVRVEAMRIRLDHLERRHLADARAVSGLTERRALRAVTRLAVLLVDRRTAAHERLPHAARRKLRRLCRPQEVGDAGDGVVEIAQLIDEAATDGLDRRQNAAVERVDVGARRHVARPALLKPVVVEANETAIADRQRALIHVVQQRRPFLFSGNCHSFLAVPGAPGPRGPGRLRDRLTGRVNKAP